MSSTGSAAWLRSERNSVNRLYTQDVEDFAFSARQEMDWLNEHMEGVLAASLGGVDVADLLKTPAKSGKSVLGASVRRFGSAKKRAGGVVKGKEKGGASRHIEDVFNPMPPPPRPSETIPSALSEDVNPNEQERGEPEPELEVSDAHLDNQRSMHEDIPMTQPVLASQRSHAHPARRVSKVDTPRDSGNWSQSSGVPSQQHQRIIARPRSPRKIVDSEAAVEVDEDISIDMGRKSAASASFHTAVEEEEENERATDGNVDEDRDEPEQCHDASLVSFGHSSPFQEHVDGMPNSRNSNGRSSTQSVKVASSPLRVLPVMEKRKSGRGSSGAAIETVRQNSTAVQEAEALNVDSNQPSSTLPTVESMSTRNRLSNSRDSLSPETGVEEIHSSPPPPQTDHQGAEPTPSPSSASPAPTDEPSPVPTFIRKSSLSFAALPPREPLSGRISATTTETVKLGGAGRSSWLQGRRTLGKSLGGRLTMPNETAVMEDSDENVAAVEKPAERKRSRGGEEQSSQMEKAQDGQPVPSAGRRNSRKKSRSASYKSSDEELPVQPTQKEEGNEMEVEVDDGNTVAEHNKSASQRLQERIQQLGKLNGSSRATISTSQATDAPTEPPTVAESLYPDLPQVKDIGSSRTSAAQEQQPQRQSRNMREPSAEDDDWIPPVRSGSLRITATASKLATASKSASLGRSNTVPAPSTPGTKNQALRDTILKKTSDISLKDPLPQKKSSRSDLATASGKPNLPQSLSFNAINSPHNTASPARHAATRFEDKSSPKLVSKKSYVAPSASTLQRSSVTDDSSVPLVKEQSADAFKRAKEMYIKSTAPGSPVPSESIKSGPRLGQKSSIASMDERSSSPRTPRQGTPSRDLYPDLANRMAIEPEGPAKSKRQTRGSRSKELLQKQHEEEEEATKKAQEARRLKEEEQAQKAAMEEKARIEEKRRLAEQRRKEKELQKQMAAQKKVEEEARIQREKEAREEEMRKHKEELQRKEEELKRLMEEQKFLIQKREEEARLKEEELRRQEIEQKRREEEEDRAAREEEVKRADAKRIAEEERRVAEEEARKHAELEELRRKQGEDLRRQQEAAERRKRDITPVREPESEEDPETPAPPPTNASASRIARPKSAMGGRPPSRLQPPSGGKRPLRPQPPPKVERSVKPTPVSIQVGTASQRAALDRQKPGAPPPSSALLSAMKDAFAPKERPATAEPTLVTSNSAPNLKKSTSAQSIAASASTSNLKKASTMDEKRREENRRLIEARREEIRRKEEEEKRKAAVQPGKRTLERDVEPPKKTMPKSMGTKGPTAGPATKITRVPANANLRKLAAAAVEDVATAPMNSQSQLDLENQIPDTEQTTKKGPKRAFNTEDELTSHTTTAAPTATGSTYGNRLAAPKMPDAKKRKTEEWELDNLPPAPTTGTVASGKAPVRPSATGSKRDWPAKSTYVQSYTSTGSSTAAAVPFASGKGSGGSGGSGGSTIKVATKTSMSTITTPHVESAKFSTEKIRFAADSTITTPAAAPPPSKTPKDNNSKVTKKSALKAPTDANGKRVFSPMKGDGIELPEIPTDSEDDYSSSRSDSDDDGWGGGAGAGGSKSKFAVPQWAESPELKQALVAQQTMDPEEVFGPIGPLQMEEIFRGSGAQGKARFRNRSSSANWSVGDKLTRDEIERDLEARKRMIERGGWEMGVMPESDKER